MLAVTVSVNPGTIVSIPVPADVGTVRVFSPDDPASLTINIPGIHGNTYVPLSNVIDGDEFSLMNGIRTINLQSIGALTAVAFVTRK